MPLASDGRGSRALSRLSSRWSPNRCPLLGTLPFPLAAPSPASASRGARTALLESPVTGAYVNGTGSTGDTHGSQQVAARIAALGGWRQSTLQHVRDLIREAVPGVVEELKWARSTSPGVPTWSHDGIICTGEPYRSVVKLTFARGAALDDPAGLFNASLQGNTRRAIDIGEGAAIDAEALKSLFRAAAALNVSRRKARPARASRPEEAAAGDQ